LSNGITIYLINMWNLYYPVYAASAVVSVQWLYRLEQQLW
jgi:hypothetical protein